MSSIDTLTATLEASDRPHAETALANVEALAEIHEVGGLVAACVEGYVHYLATGKGQGALDQLRAKDKDLYAALRGKLIEASGVKRMSTRTSAVNEESLGEVAAFLGA